MEIIEDEVLEIENLHPKDKLTEKDIENITGSNLFLALIEPKKFATKEVIDFCNHNLTRENIEENLNSALEKLKKTDMNSYVDALDEIEDRGLENIITELQLEYFERLQNYKEARRIVTSTSLAFIAPINNKLYDFIDSSYLDLNEYYINYAVSFDTYFTEEDWQFVCFNKQGIIKLSFNNEIAFIIDLFWEENKNKIDSKASQKILALK